MDSEQMTYIDSDPPSGVCGVCGSDSSKYRCSRCRLPYCSLKCYKVHNKAQSELCETRKRKREEKNEKDREITKRAKVEAVMESLRRKEPKKKSAQHAVFDHKEMELCRLTEKHYDALTKSTKVIDLLKSNPKLRDFLKSLDDESCHTKRKARLVCALEESNEFQKFADTALRSMGFLRNDGDGEYFTIESSLGGEDSS